MRKMTPEKAREISVLRATWETMFDNHIAAAEITFGGKVEKEALAHACSTMEHTRIEMSLIETMIRKLEGK